MTRFLLALTTFASLTISAQTMPSFITDSLDNYIQQGLKDWEIPGLAIVVVKNGKVVVMKGFGVRDIDTKQLVDENTHFMIASNSKLFTGTALANLEAQGRLSLDDKFTKYFPDYALYDPAATRLLTVKDLLSHRIGTTTFQGDFTFWNSHLTRAQIMQKMRLLKPTNPFRQNFGYCNSCFMAAGELVPKLTGMSWQKYVADSILARLEMTHSTAVSADMPHLENVAVPYTTSFSDSLHRVPYDRWDNLGPAASIISCVNDLSHWLMFQLDSGRYKGTQVMPFAVLQKTRDINTVISSRKSPRLPTHYTGYGLGLFTCDYNGRQVYWHTGGAGGMLSNVCFVPEENLGIAILTNNDNQGFFELLRYQLLDAYLGVPYKNRSKAALGDFTKEHLSDIARIKGFTGRVKNNKPALPLSAYAGEYHNKLYGSMSAVVKGGHIELRFNGHDSLTARLDYLDNDDWLLRYDNIEYGVFVTKFKMENKAVRSVEIKANDFVEYDPYTFAKK